MNRTLGLLSGLLLLQASAAAGATESGGMAVELWTDRGQDAVYQPGEEIELNVRSSDEGYLLLYEMDSEGRVRVLWPERGNAGFVEGEETVTLPSQRSDVELVVDGPAGQGYVVAIVSRAPFMDLPWYLRPYDLQAEEIGYAGDPDEEEGVTAEGRIVGDPFVAMERIRRRVLEDPEDLDAFGSAYTSYYVHQRVRYPRYLCYDCHRPNQWAWWDGFDPYYTTCDVFDFRVNWGWHWGPRIWFGTVPYYYFVYRYDCPPSYRVHSARYRFHSSWDGWRRWSLLWGGSLTRYKSPPPPGYVPPSKYRDRWPKERPPGLLAERRQVGKGRLEPGMRPSRGRSDLGRRTTEERERAWRRSNPRTADRGAFNPPRRDEKRVRDRDSEPRGPGRGMADRIRNPLREPGRGRFVGDPGQRREVLRDWVRERNRETRDRPRMAPPPAVGHLEPRREHRRVPDEIRPHREAPRPERPRVEPRREEHREETGPRHETRVKESRPERRGGGGRGRPPRS